MTQITVSAGSAVDVPLPANNRLIIAGSGTYRVGPLGTSQRPTVDQLIDTTSTVGPFEDSCVVRIAANLGATYEVIAPTDALDSRGLPAPVSGGGSSVAPSAFTSRALTTADNGAPLVCSGSQTATVNTGLGAGFGCSFKGTIAFAGTATVNDVRVSGAANPWCALVQTGTDAYDAVGSKA